MKKAGIVSLATIALSSVIITSGSPRIRDEAHWYWTLFKDNSQDYAEYIESKPGGLHVDEARRHIDDLDYEEANRAYTKEAFGSYLITHKDGYHIDEAKTNIASLQSAMNQSPRIITGSVKMLNESSMTLEIQTAMGEDETLRLTDNTNILKEGESKNLDDLTLSEGLQIEYANLPNGTLLAKSISLGYTVSYCSCGSNCACPLTRGCRTIKY